MSEYPWEGNPLCIHGYQFDCQQCRMQPSILEDVTWAANQVYIELGSGHTEAVYEAALEIELEQIYSNPIRRQVPVPIYYSGRVVGTGFIDILIEFYAVIEVKTISKLSWKEEQQVRKYMSGVGLEQGVLINFGQNLEIVEVKGKNEQTTSEKN